MWCSPDTYVLNFFGTRYTYCPKGYNYFNEDCCNRAAIIGWSCGLSVLACALLIVLIVCQAKRRQSMRDAFAT